MTGDNIKRVRKEQKLTQKKLGELCGIDEANLRKYENGRLEPSLTTIRKIAAALNISLSELVDDWSAFTSEEYKKDFEIAKSENKPGHYSQAEEYFAYSLLKLDEIIMNNFHLLNTTGKNKLINYSTDLTKIPEYLKKDE